MNVTFMLMYHYPEKVSSYHLYNDLMEHLRNSGHFVHVITPNPVRGMDQLSRYIYKREKKKELEFEHQLVTRVNVPFDTNSGLIKRAIRYFLLSTACSKALKKVKTDVVYLQSDPPIIYAHYASKVCKRLNIPFVYNIQDLAPDNITKLKKTNLLYRFLDSIHIKAMKRADKIIVISEDILDLIVKKGIDASKIEVIPNWKFEPCEHISDTFHHPIIDSKEFEVVYAGNIGYVQNMDIILNAAARITDPDVSFSIIGDGVRRNWLVNEIKQRNLTNVKLYDKIRVEDIDSIYRKADVNLITLKKGIIYTAMPSKTSSCIDAKKPIVVSCDLESKYAKMITSNNIGVVVDPSDDLGLSEAILNIKKSVVTVNATGFIKAHESFDKSKNIDRYYNIFTHLTKNSEVSK